MSPGHDNYGIVVALLYYPYMKGLYQYGEQFFLMTWGSAEEKNFGRLYPRICLRRPPTERGTVISGYVCQELMKACGLVGNPNDIEGTPRALFVSTFELLRLLTLEMRQLRCVTVPWGLNCSAGSAMVICDLLLIQGYTCPRFALRR